MKQAVVNMRFMDHCRFKTSCRSCLSQQQHQQPRVTQQQQHQRPAATTQQPWTQTQPHLPQPQLMVGALPQPLSCHL